jgi:hypothetical protein
MNDPLSFNRETREIREKETTFLFRVFRVFRG